MLLPLHPYRSDFFLYYYIYLPACSAGKCGEMRIFFPWGGGGGLSAQMLVPPTKTQGPPPPPQCPLLEIPTYATD